MEELRVEEFVVKTSYNSDIRRFRCPVHCSFDQLCTLIADLYSISSFIVKYVDDEGDLISVTSTPELKEALRISPSKLLRLSIYQTKKPIFQREPLIQQKIEEKKEAPIVHKKKLIFEEEEDEKDAELSEWSCSICTFINPIAQNACAMCRNERHNVKIESKPVGDKRVEHAEEKIEEVKIEEQPLEDEDVEIVVDISEGAEEDIAQDPVIEEVRMEDEEVEVEEIEEKRVEEDEEKEYPKIDVEEWSAIKKSPVVTEQVEIKVAESSQKSMKLAKQFALLSDETKDSCTRESDSIRDQCMELSSSIRDSCLDLAKQTLAENARISDDIKGDMNGSDTASMSRATSEETVGLVTSLADGIVGYNLAISPSGKDSLLDDWHSLSQATSDSSKEYSRQTLQSTLDISSAVANADYDSAVMSDCADLSASIRDSCSELCHTTTASSLSESTAIADLIKAM